MPKTPATSLKVYLITKNHERYRKVDYQLTQKMNDIVIVETNPEFSNVMNKVINLRYNPTKIKWKRPVHLKPVSRTISVYFPPKITIQC